MSFTIAIVGRPNVGKSTLFNRLVGRGKALVDATPGLTRDRIEGAARIGPITFRAIDTAGLAEGPDESLEGRLRRQTHTALAEADLALMLIDAKSGLTALDRHVAGWLRRQDKPVILVANKCEGRAAESFAAEAWGLGLGTPIPISAQQGEGMADLAEALMAATDVDAPAAETGAETPPLRLTVAGRPNVGKSSLINRLIQDERLLTGPEPGLTRDAVTIRWQWRDRQIELVDTAGLRRKARIEPDSLERMSGKAAVTALRRAEIVLLLLDASAPLEKQDLAIANLAVEAGSVDPYRARSGPSPRCRPANPRRHRRKSNPSPASNRSRRGPSWSRGNRCASRSRPGPRTLSRPGRRTLSRSPRFRRNRSPMSTRMHGASRVARRVHRGGAGSGSAWRCSRSRSSARCGSVSATTPATSRR
jgi:small GTP-binding protein